MKLSVAIPTHDMKNKDFFIRRSLDILSKQTFKDFEVVISDDSDDDLIGDIAKKEYSDLNIVYIKNHKKGMAPNTNWAICNSNGEMIKILYLDDYLADESSLQDIIDNFDGSWLVTGCLHDNGKKDLFNSHYPNFSPEDKDNYIGSPSVLTIKNDTPLMFDESITWLLDFDYYKRLYKRYGMPRMLMKYNVIIGVGDHQMTNILNDELKTKEREYVTQKHG